MDEISSPTTVVTADPIDTAMMQRCIALSKTAASQGEYPFAAVICKNGAVVAESVNRVARDRDTTRHAEIVAISLAQKSVGKTKLNGCTLYSNMEPCAMCAFVIRETRMSRVVFSLRSPIMGGFSRWNVLGDTSLSDVMPEAFGRPVEVIAGLLAKEAAQVWRDRNPLIWKIIRDRGCFQEGPVERWHTKGGKRSYWREMLSILHN
jgi:tRNA(adenine34) deaminase